MIITQKSGHRPPRMNKHLKKKIDWFLATFTIVLFSFDLNTAEGVSFKYLRPKVFHLPI